MSLKKVDTKMLGRVLGRVLGYMLKKYWFPFLLVVICHASGRFVHAEAV